VVVTFMVRLEHGMVIPLRIGMSRNEITIHILLFDDMYALTRTKPIFLKYTRYQYI
jgi:hypothetical protein